MDFFLKIKGGYQNIIKWLDLKVQINEPLESKIATVS